MANLTPHSAFPAVYQLEVTDPVLGGPGGIMNLQAQQLLDRTTWLLDRMNQVLNTTGNRVRLDRIENVGSAAGANIGLAAGNVMGVGAFGLGGNAPSLTNLSDGTAKPGFSVVQVGATDSPEPATWGTLLQIGGNVTTGGIGGIVQQMFITGTRIYFRQYITDTWGAWVFTGFGDDVAAVTAFAVASPPFGWLRCNGAAISRTAYAALFAKIGVAYGSGDGTTTFNLPDLRGRFVRGWDNSAGVDPLRVFGSYQADSFAAHTHPLLDVNAGGGGTPGFDFATLTTGSGGSVSTQNVQSAGGTETAPKNVALLYCIKYI